MALFVAAAEITLDEVNAKGADVQKLITSKSFHPALLRALENTPLSTKSAEIKAANRDIVFKALGAIGDKEIGDAVGAVSEAGDEALDVLLKYIYLALATPQPALPAGVEGSAAEAVFLEQKKWSASLLKWHPLVTEKTGPGGIIRVMTDRKTVV